MSCPRDNYLGVFGHTALDVILKVDSLPVPNSSTALKNKVIRFGGTAANIARASQTMGIDTALASFVGDDMDPGYTEALKSSNVDITDLDEKEGYRTPKCWIVTSEEEDQMAIVDQGAMEYGEEFDLQTHTVDSSEFIHIGTGRPRYHLRVAEMAKKKDKKLGFDPAQELKYVYTPEIFKELLEKSDIYFCNQTEFETSLDYLSAGSETDMLDWVDSVIVTKGSEGCTLYKSDGGNVKVIDIPAFMPEKVVEPTGAGDAFRAGFYFGLSRDFNIERNCEIACARASFAVEHAGPQEGLVGREEVMERLEDGKRL